ncbi:hypothetical protein M231_00628 [Tremella mesenterica]|uniref:Uncharacterized protein n=1 Tax=Tremella mesenterica TaxID=5217 RepID=A0A4V1M4X7_TREME|nr:hypothetical protein M231_00628 [Tremella mesenterica]
MAPPPVTIYVTSLTSQPRVRQHIDLLHRSLKALEIPYESFDLVVDQDAKTRWQRSKPTGMVVGLPGYLVGGEWVGTMEDFEYAVEEQRLPEFLKQNLDISTEQEGNTSVSQIELENLMREMSDADLDVLAGQLGVESDAKVGLLSSSTALSPDPPLNTQPIPSGVIPTSGMEKETHENANEGKGVQGRSEHDEKTNEDPKGANNKVDMLEEEEKILEENVKVVPASEGGAVKEAEDAKEAATVEDATKDLEKVNLMDAEIAEKEKAAGKEKVD